MLTFAVVAMAASDPGCFYQGMAEATPRDVLTARWVSRALTKRSLGRRPTQLDVERLVAGLLAVSDPVTPLYEAFSTAVLVETFFNRPAVTDAAGWDDELAVHVALAAYIMRVVPVPVDELAALVDVAVARTCGAAATLLSAGGGELGAQGGVA